VLTDQAAERVLCGAPDEEAEARGSYAPDEGESATDDCPKKLPENQHDHARRYRQKHVEHEQQYSERGARSARASARLDAEK
jgi:hypothetical protein